MNELILHIGLHKTGTTYLQKSYFPFLKGLNYFSGYPFFTLFGQQELVNKTLISKEALSGLPWNEKWKKGIPNEDHWFSSFKLSVNNLKTVFPDARIIIVFRKHGDLLLSLYKQYIQEGGILPFSKFYGDEGVIRKEDLLFQERIQVLKNNFNHVDVLSYEKFKAEGDSYFDNYFSTLGIVRTKSDVGNQKRNHSVSGKKVELLRGLNKVYFYRTPFYLRRFISFLRLTPRRIVQERLGFWKSEDSLEMKSNADQINLEFKQDWESIEFSC